MSAGRCISLGYNVVLILRCALSLLVQSHWFAITPLCCSGDTREKNWFLAGGVHVGQMGVTQQAVLQGFCAACLMARVFLRSTQSPYSSIKGGLI